MPYSKEYYENNKEKFKQYYLKYKDINKKLCEKCKKCYLNLTAHEKSVKHQKQN